MKAVKTTSQTKKVIEFHNTFDHPVSETVVENSYFLTPEWENRVNYIKEEAKEGFDCRTIEDASDFLMDMLYFIKGGIAQLGLQHIENELFEEVHKSNMSKLCNSKDEADKAVEIYAEQGVEVIIIPKVFEDEKKNTITKYILKRKIDGKILKSSTFFTPNLIGIINKENGVNSGSGK